MKFFLTLLSIFSISFLCATGVAKPVSNRKDKGLVVGIHNDSTIKFSDNTFIPYLKGYYKAYDVGIGAHYWSEEDDLIDHFTALTVHAGVRFAKVGSLHISAGGKASWIFFSDSKVRPNWLVAPYIGFDYLLQEHLVLEFKLLPLAYKKIGVSRESDREWFAHGVFGMGYAF